MKRSLQNMFFYRGFLGAALISLLSVGLFSCAAGTDELKNPEKFNHEYDGERTLVFHEEGEEWEVELDGDNITSIKIEGRTVPADKYEQHRPVIDQKIRELDEEFEEMHAKMDDFDEELAEEMNALHEEFSDASDFDFDFHFNGEEFRRGMQQLREELANLDDIKVEIDMDDIHEDIQQAVEEARNIRVNINQAAIQEEVRRATENLKDIDWSEFHSEMEQFGDEMKDMKVDLKRAKKEIRKYNRFMNEMRDGLESDGLIEDADEDFDMEFNQDELIIDGKTAPDEIHKKYKSLFKDYFNKEMDDHTTIRSRR